MDFKYTFEYPTLKDEIGDVVKGFNAFVEKLHGIVTSLQDSKNNLITVDNLFNYCCIKPAS